MTTVALDARLTRQMSVGMQAYSRELRARLPLAAPELDFVAFDQGANFSIAEQVQLPLAIRRSGAALTHYFSQYTPLAPPMPYVVTIHDLIHLRFPQYFKKKVGPYYRLVAGPVARRAARVITDDERTIGDLQRFLRVDARKIRVIPLGVDEAYAQPVEPYRAEAPYILYAGNHREHKDLPTLFEAWRRLPEDCACDLYLTGPDDFNGALCAYQTTRAQIVVLGDVPARKLAALYAGARAYVHPALCEGFGFPMLEAMAAGTPVIACQDAVPRVLESAALLFGPRDASMLLNALVRVLRDEGLRTALVNEGREVARGLTWERCARSTAAVYREVLEETT